MLAAKSAKNAQIRYDPSSTNTAVTAKSWTVTPEQDEIDTSNTEGGGFYEYVGGLQKLGFNVEFDYDSAALLFARITVGLNTNGVRFYLNGTGGSAYWVLPQFYTKTIPMVANVKETIKGTWTGDANGTFTIPSGTTF